jgi:hypothetical protein
MAVLLALAPRPAAAIDTVARVDLAGFNHVMTEAVRRDLPLKVGALAGKAAIEEARDWLESLGLFISVTAATQDTEAGVVVTFKVVENPPVATVMIDGTGDIAAAALRQELTTRPNQMLDRIKIAKDCLLITAEYRKLGLVAMAEASFDPRPTAPDVPVVVTFRITDLLVGSVQCQPLNYVVAAGLQPFVTLKVGQRLRLDDLVAQQQRFGQVPLFDLVGEPTFRPKAGEAKVDLFYPVTEAERPFLSDETLPLVDLQRLRTWLSFETVSMVVSVRDLEPWASPEEIKAGLEDPGTGLDAVERAWRQAVWTRRAGQPAGAAMAAVAAAAGAMEPLPPAARMRLGQAQLALGQWAAGYASLRAALTGDLAPAARLEAQREMLATLIAGQGLPRDEIAEEVPKVIQAGLDDLLKLPATASLADLSQAFQFYFTALALAPRDVGLKLAVRLDSPCAGKLLRAVFDYGRTLAPDNDPDPAKRRRGNRDRRHLGKLLCGLGFIAHAVGAEIAGSEGLERWDDLLETSQEAFLVDHPDDQDAADPAGPFCAAVNALITGHLPLARDLALAGLRRFPLSERLVDLYVASCHNNRYSNLTATQAAKAVDNALAELGPRVAAGELGGWGPNLLLAKLQLARLQALGPDQTPQREAGRAEAEAAAARAVAAAADQPAGWWLLGLARLKGPAPATAVEPLAKTAELRPDDTDARYAQALAQILAGDRAGGFELMRQLRGPAPAPTLGPQPAG